MTACRLALDFGAYSQLGTSPIRWEVISHAGPRGQTRPLHPTRHGCPLYTLSQAFLVARKSRCSVDSLDSLPCPTHATPPLDTHHCSSTLSLSGPSIGRSVPYRAALWRPFHLALISSPLSSVVASLPSLCLCPVLSFACPPHCLGPLIQRNRSAIHDVLGCFKLSRQLLVRLVNTKVSYGRSPSRC